MAGEEVEKMKRSETITPIKKLVKNVSVAATSRRVGKANSCGVVIAAEAAPTERRQFIG